MTQEPCYKKSKERIYLNIKLIPRASRDEVIGLFENRLKVMVRAVPQKGKANEALKDIIAKFFSIKRSECAVVSGHKSSLKTVFIASEVENKFYGKWRKIERFLNFKKAFFPNIYCRAAHNFHNNYHWK